MTTKNISNGIPYKGNPHMRFDEEVAAAVIPRRWSCKATNKSVLLILAWIAFAFFLADAATLTWVGGDGDWSDAANWENELGASALPAASDDVVIQSDSEITITLAAPTPALASLTLGGGAATNAICVTSWNASIEAVSVKIADKGVLTCQGAFEKADMGRVWIKCTDLDIAAGGAINVSHCGYLAQGKLASGMANGYGPGAAVNYGMGASHGGAGGMTVYSYMAGTLPMLYVNASYDNVLYDDPEAPVEPGSSGRASNYARGGSGGGAVRVEATGRVTVAGAILASGQETASASAGVYNQNSHGTAGAGGSIYITCDTFAGTNGVIRADGGDGHFVLLNFYPSMPWPYGDMVGGGGMIAIHYDSEHQVEGATRNMTISAAPGTYRSVYRGWTPPFALSDRYYINGDLGTLHFTDGKLVRDLLGCGLSGRILGFSEWTCDSLDFTSGFVRFQGEGFKLKVTGNLTVTGAKTRLDIGGVAITNRVWRPEIWAGREQVTLDVGGDLVVSGGARLDLRSAETNAPSSWGAVATIGGTMTVGASGWVYAWCDPVNGGAPKFKVHNLTVAEGGTFTSERRGYAGAPGYDNGSDRTYWNKRTNGYGPTPGYCNMTNSWRGYVFPDGTALNGHYSSGGSHGGLGGLSTATNRLSVMYAHTSGDEWRPMLPGSGAGAGPMAYGNGSGGGVIYVEAANHVQVDGKICADGDEGYSCNVGGSANSDRSAITGGTWYGVETAGGAGGSIFISSKTFAGAATGVLSAKGGDIGNMDAVAEREGAGGGGRIAVWTGREYPGQMNSVRVKKFASAGECPNCDFLGTATAAGGTNRYATIESDCATLNGGDGTVRFVHVTAPPGTIIAFE